MNSPEQQSQAAEERLRGRESDLTGQLSAADERIQNVFVSAELSLKRQLARQQKMATPRDHLFAAVLTSTVDIEAKLASVHEELAVINDTIGKLHSKFKTVIDQMDYNRQRAIALYSQAVGEWLKPQSDHRFKVLTKRNRVEDLESKFPGAVDADSKTCERNRLVFSEN